MLPKFSYIDRFSRHVVIDAIVITNSSYDQWGLIASSKNKRLRFNGQIQIQRRASRASIASSLNRGLTGKIRFCYKPYPALISAIGNLQFPEFVAIYRRSVNRSGIVTSRRDSCIRPHDRIPVIRPRESCCRRRNPVKSTGPLGKEFIQRSN